MEGHPNIAQGEEKIQKMSPRNPVWNTISSQGPATSENVR